MELHHDSIGDDFLVGDVYLGRIRKLITGLNAAFVDIGHDKDAFLHYHDLGPDIRSSMKFSDQILKSGARDFRLQHFRFEPEIVKTGKIDDVFKPGQQVIVQVVKEPISTKGPRLSSALSLSGRYLILMPFSNVVSLSKKIEDRPERDRLKKIITGLRPKNHGIIVRTNAEGVSLEELEQDLKRLLSDWDKLCTELAAGKAKLSTEVDKTVSILRDILNSDYQRITVDSPAIFKQVKKYLSATSPDHEDILKLYKGDKPLFEYMDIDKNIKTLFNKIVNIGAGAYLIIEHTEAMHVIDVNSGSKRVRQIDQEATSLKTNTEACKEIARQLRLRDMGGIVVIDFIDMRDPNNRKALYERMRDEMADDRAKHTILPLSKFGIMQITRQRVRPEIHIDESIPCPVCNGTGHLAKDHPINEEIETRLDAFIRDTKPASVTLRLHPYLYGFYTSGFPSLRMQLMWRYKKMIRIEKQENLMLNQYEIV